MDYPVDVQVDYGSGERSRGLAVLGLLGFLKIVLAVPHLIALAVAGAITGLASWFGYWAILFTGRQPDGFNRFIAGTISWGNRVYAWIPSASDEYPAFGFDDAPGGTQTTIEIDRGPRNRILAIVGILGIKAALAVPHFIVVAVLQVVAGFGAWIGYWIILFTGKLPEDLHGFFVGTIRWSARTSSWVGSLTDTYPPFSME